MKYLHTLLFVVLFSGFTWAQSPDKMSFQAVVRDMNSALVSSQSIGMQISILQASTSGSSVYIERHFPTTNSNGLVTIEIGAGTVVSGDFSTIDWADGPYFIKTETDPNGGANYTISGTSQLLSVPYALHAKTAENVNLTGSEAAFEGWDKNSSDDFDGKYSSLTDKPNYAQSINDLTDAKLTLNSIYFGQDAGVLSSGQFSLGFGKETLKESTGKGNTALGFKALTANSTGEYNTAVGDITLGSLTTGVNNTALGVGAGFVNTKGSGNVFLGFNAGKNEAGSNKLYIENSNTRAPLIGGDFETDEVTINGQLEVTKSLLVLEEVHGSVDDEADMKAYVYGHIMKDGTISAEGSSKGFIITKTGTGKYEIKYPRFFILGQKFVYMVTPVNASDELSYPRVATMQNNVVFIYDIDGKLVDSDFYLVVYKK